MFEQSRRYFKTEYEGIEFDFDGVDVKEGMIRFARPNPGMYKELLFLNKRECLIWLKNLEDNIMKHDADKVIRMSYPVYRNESVITAVNEEWELIKSQMPRADLVEPGDIVVFNMWLANNVIARNQNRISLEVLKDLTKTIVGKLRLKDHDDRLKIGKFYKAVLKKTELDEAMEILKSYPHKGLKQHLEKVIEMEKGIYWLVTSYYMLNKTEEQKAQVLSIAAGIEAYYTSISFFAPIIVPLYESDEKKKLLWWEWRNDGDEHAEAVEGSGVYLGNLYETTTKNKVDEKDVLNNIPEEHIRSWVKLEDMDDEGIKDCCEQLDLIISRGFLFANEENNEVGFYRKANTSDYINLVDIREKLANKKEIGSLIPTLELIGIEVNEDLKSDYAKKLPQQKLKSLLKTNTEGSIVDIKLKTLGIELMNIDVEKDKSWHENLNNAVDKAFGEKMSEGNSALDRIKEVTEIFGEEFTAEQMKIAKETAENYLKSKVDEVMKWGKASGAIKDDEIAEKQEAFGKFKIDELDARAKDYMELAGVRNPQYKAMIELHEKGILPDNLDGINTNDDKKLTVGVSDKSFMVG